MKKIFSMMVAMATLLSFVACGEDTTSTGGGTQKEGKLDTPVLTIAEQTADSVTISWGAVADAVSYSVALDTDLSTTDKTSVTFTDLSIGKYVIRVKAIAAANSKYNDSDYATIEVNIEGESEVDWFTQDLFITNELESEGYYDFNSVFYTWAGVGVTELKYGLFRTEDVNGMSNDEILAELDAVSQAQVFEYINTTGYTGVFTGIPASTDVTLVVYVTNDAGKSALVKNSVVTAEAQIPSAYEAWIGTYSVTASHAYQFNDDGSYGAIAQPETFTVTMEYDPTNDGIYLDGMSVLGEGWPTLAFLNEEGGLDIYSGLSLGQAQDGTTYVWMIVAEQYNADGSLNAAKPYGFYSDQIPSFGLTMTDGAITCAPYSFNLDEAGSQYITVVASDVFGIQGEQLYFLIEAWPASYRSGEFTFTKTSNEVLPSTQAKSCGTPNAVLAPFATSVVLN